VAIKRRSSLIEPGDRVTYKPLVKDEAYWRREKTQSRRTMDRLGIGKLGTLDYREAQDRWSTADEALSIKRRTGKLPLWAVQ